MEYILVTDATRMNSLASLRHLADKNRIANTTIKLKQDAESEPVGFYVSMYSSNGINSSLISCAEQVYVQAVSGEWFPVKDSAFPNLSILIGGLFEDRRIIVEAEQETSDRLQDLHERVQTMQEAELPAIGII